MAKKSKREQHWHGLGFKYIGTGTITVGKKKNPHMKDGDSIDDVRKVDVLIKLDEAAEVNREMADTKTSTGNFGFWFSDPLIGDGKPYIPGAAGNLDPEFRAKLTKETCLPDAA